MATFPMTMDDLTPEWLTERLAGEPACRVTKVDAQLFANQGWLSQLVEVDLAWSCDGSHAEPAHLLAKLPTPSPDLRGAAVKRDWYRNEARFYRDFGADPGITTARPFFADAGEGRDEIALLMADMAPAVPVRRGTLEDGLYREAVAALAKFHAKWWQSDSVLESDWLFGVDLERDDELLRLDEVELHAAALTNQKRIGGIYPEYLFEAAQATAASRREIRRRYETRPITLLHGDFYEPQFFVGSEAGGGFAVCDWQMIAAGPGAEDLSRFLGIILDIDLRRRLEPDLLALYHETLVAQGVSEYSLDDLREDYRWGLSRIIGIQTLGFAAMEDEQIERIKKQSEASGSPPFQNTEALAACLQDHDYLSLFA
jgi:hypothetical protein